MGNTTQQPPAPLPAGHGTTSPPPTSHSDMFLDMIQGKSVTVVVGQHSLYCTYTLPVSLLCVHSLYLRHKIANLSTTSKKRKLCLSDEGEEAEVKLVVEAKDKDKDEEPTEKEGAKEDMGNEESVIRLPEVDPVIFGLFLKFIYKDSYPANVDAWAPTIHPHYRPLTAVPKSITPGSNTTATPRQPSSNIPRTSSNGHIQTTPLPSHMPTLMPPPPPPQVMNQTEFIPPSIHAWLLAQRLGAISFMNHAISHIYTGIGVYFALTPSLMDYVWKETSPSPTTSSTTVLTPSPLRKLLLDVLVMNWSRYHPSNPNAIIARSLSVPPNFSVPLKVAWDRLFDEHTELRSEFIHGLQGGVQLMPVNAYFATPKPTGQSGMAQGGVAASEFGKEHGHGSGQVKKEVAVKEEQNGETDVLAGKNESRG
ncbi:hypothetical protein ACET3X_000267 [Alternaria dauci]|uniref:BTB domain-containing protein n=1 Tax=Alternaria dauci TaxID=48095 RepID=A0ABR3UV41_9PLEO